MYIAFRKKTLTYVNIRHILHIGSHIGLRSIVWCHF